MKKVMALFLSLLLLGSQMGFAISVHYCGGKIAYSSISLLKTDLGCGMEKTNSVCENIPTSNLVSEKSCCQNQSQVVQVEDDFNQKQSVSNANINFIQLFTLITNELIISDKKLSTKFQNPPSLLVRNNSQVLYQTFLI